MSCYRNNKSTSQSLRVADELSFIRIPESQVKYTVMDRRKGREPSLCAGLDKKATGIQRQAKSRRVKQSREELLELTLPSRRDSTSHQQKADIQNPRKIEDRKK